MSEPSPFPQSGAVAAKPGNPTPSRIALVIGCLVALIWSASSSLRTNHGLPDGSLESSAEQFGYMAGTVMATVLIIPGIIWALIYFVFIKPSRRPVGGKYFVILAAAALLGCAPLLIGGSLAVSNAGLTREMAQATSDYQAALNADERAYAKELQTSGLGRSVHIADLARDLPAAEARVVAVRALISKYDALRQQRAREIRARVSTMARSDAERKEGLEAFDAGYGRGRVLVDRRWAIERKAVDELQELIDVLKRSRGHWRVQGETVGFERQSDIAALQAIGERMDATAAEQRALKAQINARSNPVEAAPKT